MLGWLSGRRGARFLLEPPPEVGVFVKRGRQDLQRHVAAEHGVGRPVHISHAAGAQVRDDLIAIDALADERHAPVARGPVRRDVLAKVLQGDRRRVPIGVDQRDDVGVQRVIGAARLAQELVARPGVALERRVEQIVNALPAGVAHRPSSCGQARRTSVTGAAGDRVESDISVGNAGILALPPRRPSASNQMHGRRLDDGRHRLAWRQLQLVVRRPREERGQRKPAVHADPDDRALVLDGHDVAGPPVARAHGISR